jgi:hypothetical protein
MGFHGRAAEQKLEITMQCQVLAGVMESSPPLDSGAVENNLVLADARRTLPPQCQL